MPEEKVTNGWNGWAKHLPTASILIGLGGAIIGGLSTMVLNQSASVGTSAVTAQKLADLHDEYKSVQSLITANTLADGVTRIEVTNRLTALETQVIALSKSVDKLTIAIETKK